MSRASGSRSRCASTTSPRVAGHQRSPAVCGLTAGPAGAQPGPAPRTAAVRPADGPVTSPADGPVTSPADGLVSGAPEEPADGPVTGPADGLVTGAPEEPADGPVT